MHNTDAKCPECRALYIPSTETVQENDNFDYEMPQLESIENAPNQSLIPMANYTINYINNILTNPSIAINEQHLRLIDRFIELIDDHHAIINWH
jgi:hypothetical protein